MRITLIAALAENGAIGLGNRLLYRLPADMRRFKELTTGHAVLMGRRTYESLPKGALPNRLNIVLSRSGTAADFPGCLHATSLDEALALAASPSSSSYEGGELFVMGGAQVYAQALPLASRLCLTLVHDTPAAADAFFPSVDRGAWQETFRQEHPADEKHAVPFTFIDLERKGE